MCPPGDRLIVVSAPSGVPKERAPRAGQRCNVRFHPREREAQAVPGEHGDKPPYIHALFRMSALMYAKERDFISAERRRQSPEWTGLEGECGLLQPLAVGVACGWPRLYRLRGDLF
jgi:hypothetical protein